MIGGIYLSVYRKKLLWNLSLIMCTSIIANKGKTIVGWNLDILDMEHKVVVEEDKVYIAIKDATVGWMPLFGANSRGDFVAMPTCWPFDSRSDPVDADSRTIIEMDIDLLLRKRTLDETRQIVERETICSVPGVTFQAQLSDRAGNVLRIVPGQGHQYLSAPDHAVMTNFSPFKGDAEKHPWMGWDRYATAMAMLERADDSFDVAQCFEVLRATAQTVCPTVVSMVFDVSANVVQWCESRQWGQMQSARVE